MSFAPKAVLAVQAYLSGSSGRRILLVEGPTDKTIYEIWLKKLASPNLYTDKVEIRPLAGKREVLKVLEWFRDHGGNPGNLFGLVDRDEWSSAIISLQLSALTQLRVVASRECLESYFADPDELEPALLAENAAYTADISDFRSLLETELPAYVDHWALFSTTERLKERLTSANYPGAFHDTVPIPSDADIQNHFQTWSGLVAHPHLFNEFDALRNQARSESYTDQFRRCISSKLFFDNVVYSAPRGIQRFRNKPLIIWLSDLAENTPKVPDDIAAILQPLLI